MDFISLLLFGTTLVIATLAALVLLFAPIRPASRLFSLASLSVASWTFTNALFRLAPSTAAALLWANLSYVAAIAIGTSLVHLSWLFPTREEVPPSRKLLLWSAGFAVSLLPFVPGLVIYGITPSKSLLTHRGLYAIAAYLAATFLFAFARFGRRYRKFRGKERTRLGLFLCGAALTALFGVTFNLLFPLLGDYRFVGLGPAFALLFVITTAYAIAAHHLFDVRIVLRRAVVFTLLLGLVFALYLVLFLYLAAAFGRSAASGVPSLFAYAGGALLVGFSLDPLRRWLEDRTDRLLFQKQYEADRVLRDLAGRFAVAAGLEEALDVVVGALTGVFHARRAAILVFEPGREGRLAVERVKQSGFGTSARLFAREGDPALGSLAALPEATEAKDLKTAAPDRTAIDRTPHTDPSRPAREAALDRLRALGAALVVPLRLGERPLGLILLGEKRSGRPYSSQDLTVLEALASQTVVSIQKARFYEGDRKKSEFVSIASHELLTPITAIEGYLSLILDEHQGQVDPRAREYLAKVYASARRLSGLVKDLLSVSRIEAGRLRVVPQPIDVESLIRQALDQLRFVAAEKGLALEFTQPSEPLPRAWADPDRLAQVLVNLIGNALKYTLKGSVTVSARVTEGSPAMLEVEVKDTGIGMTQAAQAGLFEKFYRVESPVTEGISGNGLGLYITKSLVERMGGGIRARSEPGKGSAFRFTLPVTSQRHAVP